MSLLLDEDYEKLAERGFSFEENEENRFFVFKNYRLPPGMYQVDECDVLVQIPGNYNQAGNDMFWTHPRLLRADGKPIPQTMDPSQGDSRIYLDQEFCRWSRHWADGNWRAGRDDIISIQRRVDWALLNPDCL